MKRQVVIDYEWWGDNKAKAPFEHEAVLEEDAMNRIASLMKQGYVEGELCSFVGDTNYSGYWSVKKIDTGDNDAPVN